MNDYITIRDHNGERRVPMDAREVQPIRAYPMAQGDAPNVPDVVRTDVRLAGDYLNRAHSFNVKTFGLSTVVAAGFVTVGVTMTGAPLLSLAALTYLSAGYFVTWLLAFLLDAFSSPEGTALLHTWRAWRWLDREQSHRHYMELRRNFPEDWTE